MPSAISKRYAAHLVAGLSAVSCAGIVAVAWLSGCKSPSPPMNPAGDLPPMPIISAAEAANYVGSQACATCHPAETRDHQTSMHAHTLASIEDHPAIRAFESKQEVHDPALKMVYTTGMEQGRPVSRVKRTSDGATETLSPRYVVGSGNHGYTFLFERDDRYLESRLSYYPPAKRWEWTPGQQDLTPNRAPLGRPLDNGTVFSCFICHSTTLVHEGETPRPEQSIFNVGCERCHGAGREHVRLARTEKQPGAIYRFRGAPADRVVRLCGECHRSPKTIPDDELESTVDLPRFAGTAFGASECYRQSAGKLSCITCHQPHPRASEDRKGYERVCLSCHSGGQAVVRVASPAKTGGTGKACPVNPRSGCISCHMPAQSLGDPEEVKFHNHWIRVYPQTK